MDIIAFLVSNWYAYLFLPALIFVFRILDVSLGTIRVIFISKGFRILAPVMGFFEILIWLAAIQTIFGNLNNPFYMIVYAAGFSCGTFTGIIIEEKLSVGKVMIRVITGGDASSLLQQLKKNKYTMTVAGAHGPEGEVQNIIMVVKRQHTKKIIKIVKDFNPKTFFVIEDVKYASEGQSHEPFSKRVRNIFGYYRKGK